MSDDADEAEALQEFHLARRIEQITGRKSRPLVIPDPAPTPPDEQGGSD
jgi:hypothetical protein